MSIDIQEKVRPIDAKESANPLMTPFEVSEMLRVPEATLAVWRCTHRYALPWAKVGRHVRYTVEDVARFIELCKRGGDGVEDAQRQGERDE
jgi:hypothetical protein